MWCIRAFYRFTEIDQPAELQKHLKSVCERLGLRGILLIAPEGINSTMAGSAEAMQTFWTELTSDPRFQGTVYKESWADQPPFQKMRVRLKKEIVTLGVPEIPLKPGENTGAFVDAEGWNALLQDPEVVVLDVRNDYEIKIGTFKGAQDPRTKTFREFPQFIKENLETHKDKKIAMCCTGGIRCEKASSYMLSQGFKNVYQLEGGILKYMETTPPEKSLWQGECFVFDRRVAVTPTIQPGHHTVCYGCRMPLTAHDQLSPHFKQGVHCHYCYQERTQEQQRRSEERMRQLALKKREPQNLCA